MICENSKCHCYIQTKMRTPDEVAKELYPKDCGTHIALRSAFKKGYTVAIENARLTGLEKHQEISRIEGEK